MKAVKSRHVCAKWGAQAGDDLPEKQDNPTPRAGTDLQRRSGVISLTALNQRKEKKTEF